MDEQLYQRMKAFTYDFKAQSFSVDVLPYVKGQDEPTLVRCEEGMCGYFRIESAPKSMFKVVLDKEHYEQMQAGLWWRLIGIYAFVIGAILCFSFLYSVYALAPLRKALRLKEEFLKDVVHDLNTPVTSILLNAKSLRKKEESEALERIILGAKSIASLHQNLEIAYKEYVPKKESIALETFLHVRASVFKKLYPKIHFVFDTKACDVISDSDALGRIIDNLLSNACKYNRKEGMVTLINDATSVCIKDNGMGIKRCDLVFERYYKESERGLGLGLNIVKTLCDALHIAISIQSKEGEGTSVSLRFLKEEKQ